MRTDFGLGYLKESENPCVNGFVIQRSVLQKSDGRARIGLIWLCITTTG